MTPHFPPTPHPHPHTFQTDSENKTPFVNTSLHMLISYIVSAPHPQPSSRYTIKAWIQESLFVVKLFQHIADNGVSLSLVLAGLHSKGDQFINYTSCAHGIQHLDLLHNEYSYHSDNIMV